MADVKMSRYEGNPILKPIADHPFEAQNVSNCGATIHAGKVHLLYRAEGHGKAARIEGTYGLGVMWLDLDDPSKIIKVQSEPILLAETEYERIGYCQNVVYTCGAVEINGQYLVYYGCADRVLAVATVPVSDCRLA